MVKFGWSGSWMMASASLAVQPVASAAPSATAEAAQQLRQ